MCVTVPSRTDGVVGEMSRFLIKELTFGYEAQGDVEVNHEILNGLECLHSLYLHAFDSVYDFATSSGKMYHIHFHCLSLLKMPNTAKMKQMHMLPYYQSTFYVMIEVFGLNLDIGDRGDDGGAFRYL